MKIIKKILWGLLCAVFLIFTLLNVLIVAGTFFPGIPFFGTLGNMFSVGFAQIWLIFVLAVTAVCAVIARIHRSGFFRALWIASAAALLCGVFIIFSAVEAVNAEGGGADFFMSYTTPRYDSVSTETVQYESSVSDNSYADIYYTDDGASGKPVVLYIHGGGWTSGTRSNNTAYMERFAAEGYVAVTAEYDLSTENEHCVGTVEQQLTNAVAWIENNISVYGGSTERFYIIGDSAGGNLALELAYKINGGVYTTAEGTALPKVTAVSVLYPVTDMTALYYNDDPLLASAAKNMVGCYMGASPEEEPELYASVSPINYITEDAPPTCIFVGEGDTIVQPEQSYSLAEKLSAAGVENRLINVPYANHLFDMGGTNFGAQAYMNITLNWFSKYQ